ncbi:hypothetical protein AGMMS49949_01010 [Alphaproteobacteria bacterium]|nr:hypothetical protein AGMMS49949_01010 [Alphaproteobacteria bacterium]GHS95948.1 hypothetical protein AGMMS50296_1530 [Alphaproteobacteria bacterium]
MKQKVDHYYYYTEEWADEALPAGIREADNPYFKGYLGLMNAIADACDHNDGTYILNYTYPDY